MLIDWILYILKLAAVQSGVFLLLYLCVKSVLVTRLKTSVQHEFDNKLENIKKDIRAGESEIEALRSGALAGLTTRQATLYSRRVKAVEQIWSATLSLEPAESVSATMALVDYKEAAKLAETDEKTRQMFTLIKGDKSLDKLDTDGGDKARPFITEKAWNLFLAYKTILSVAMLKIDLLIFGNSNLKIIDKDLVRIKILRALPERIDTLGDPISGEYHLLLEEIKLRLLDELQDILKANHADKETVRSAAVILDEADEARRDEVLPPPEAQEALQYVNAKIKETSRKRGE